MVNKDHLLKMRGLNLKLNKPKKLNTMRMQIWIVHREAKYVNVRYSMIISNRF